MRAIVNVAVGKWYPQGQQRLRRSLIDAGDTTERIFLKRFPGKSHQQTPYGFKVDAFREAQRRGYEQVLWVDASCWYKRNLTDAWDQIERDGYLLGLEGWKVAEWCSPEVLELAGYTREQAMEMDLMLGGFIGLDLSSPIGNRFLDRWEHARDQGWFNGSWVNHRHDMTAGSIIAFELGMKLTPHVLSFANGRRGDGPAEAFMFARGMF